MLQDEELDVSPGNSGTEHENLSIVDIQRVRYWNFSVNTNLLIP